MPRSGAPRIARGTQGPERIDHPPVATAQLALGSSPHPAPEVGDVTATDVTALDRARASMREDEETRVNLEAAPTETSTLDLTLEDEEDRTAVEPARTISLAAVDTSSPLPRLTARLRRTSSPN